MNRLIEKLKEKDVIKLADENLKALDMWVVLFSPKQKCFHVETIRESVLGNTKFLVQNNGKEPDFIPVSIADTREKANVCADNLKGQWDQKILAWVDSGLMPLKVAQGGELSFNNPAGVGELTN